MLYLSVCYALAALVEYKNISKKTLQESIESEMSGNLETLLVAVGEEKHVICVFISMLPKLFDVKPTFVQMFLSSEVCEEHSCILC